MKRGISILSKKLYRSKNNRRVAGVCGGIAEYFDIDPTLVRLLTLLFILLGGAGSYYLPYCLDYHS